MRALLIIVGLTCLASDADAVSGQPLWSFPTNHTWRASPMTFMFDGTQYVAVAAGSSILSFAIQE